MTSPYVHKLIQQLRAHHNQTNAESMKKYMRDQFEFIGIKTPKRRELLKEFITEHGLPPFAELPEVVRELWELPEREFQYIALTFLEKARKKLTTDDIPFIEELIVNKSWWDTVDLLAANIVGTILQNYQDCIPVYAEKWIQSDHIWLQRTALLFQLKYKHETDEELLYHLIRQCRHSKEFFIQKAIGWALREYSKTSPASVERFVESEHLAPLSRREALKVIQRQVQRG
ncbi:DNA alkylation repair protein [Anoxybacteroides tepidamans]|uniref:DNA alkylation repair protein n=1 Tax=Anoxybacteroides tepidamans TaxID=265948 RepID=UPI00055418DC|nr:DNA alkylation repair protein [Anoxybacillus tepidamans]